MSLYVAGTDERVINRKIIGEAGSVTSFSTQAVNQAPAGTDNIVTIFEDATYTFTAADFGFSDADGNSFFFIKLASLPTNGKLFHDGAEIGAAGGDIFIEDILAGKLTFVPAPEASGAAHDSFTFRVGDNGGTADGGVNLDPTPNSFTFNVTAVNDAPVADVAASYAATEQAPLNLKGTMSIADVDAGTGIVTVTLSVGAGVLNINVGGSNATIVGGNGTGSVVISGTVAQINALLGTDATSTLTFTADSDAPPATTQLTLSVNDGGNSGGDAQTGSDSGTITIAGINDAPAGTDKIVTILEDATYTFTAADFGFTDVDGNSFGFVRIASLPANGKLLHDGGEIGAAGGLVSIEDILAGKLTFVPAPEASGAGYGTFTFQVGDNGGTGEGGVNLDQSPNTLTLNVSNVNDAPVLTPNGPIAATEQQAVALLTGVTVSDAELDAKNGGLGDYAGAEISINRNSGTNVLDTFSVVAGPNFTLDGVKLLSDGKVFGTIAINGQGFIVIRFSSTGTTATSSLVDEVIQSIRYTNSSDTPPASIDLAVGFRDGSGGLDVNLVTVRIAAVDDAGLAVNDAAATDEATSVTGNLLSNDIDVDGPAKSVAAVNGSSAAVGQQIVLASGALLTVNADGTFSYNPNGAFDHVPAASSGASNAAATDSFTYTMTGGTTATVTLTINGLMNGNNLIIGSAAAEVLTGGDGNDEINGLGGDDRLDGGGGIDTALFGGNRSSYQLVNLGGGQVRVTGPDGTDVTTGIERLQFADGVFSVPTGVFDQAITQASAEFGAGASAGSWTSQHDFPRVVADVNGDGRADIVGFGVAGTYVALGQAGGTFASMTQVSYEFGQASFAGSWTDNDRSPRMLADVNGDRRADIVGFGEAGTYVALANGQGGFGAMTLATNGFGASASAGGWESQNLYHRTLGDVNGDGRDDIVGFGINGTFVALANADGTFGELQQASTDFGTAPGAGGWSSHNQFPRMLADVNGDGRADVVGFGNTATYVAYGQANGTFGAMGVLLDGQFGAAPSAGGWESQDRHPRMAADVNGDNLADIIGFGEAGFYYALNNGAGGFGAFTLGGSAFSAEAGGWSSGNQYPRTVADVNGDGLADIIGFGENGVFVTLADGFDAVTAQATAAAAPEERLAAAEEPAGESTLLAAFLPADAPGGGIPAPLMEGALRGFMPALPDDLSTIFIA